MKKYILLITIIFQISIYAEEIDNLIDSAYNLDLELNSLQLIAETNNLSRSKELLRQEFNFSLSGTDESNTLLTYNYSNNSSQISINPLIEVSLPYPARTKLSVSTPFTFDLNDSSQNSLPFSVSLFQPINQKRKESLIPSMEFEVSNLQNQIDQNIRRYSLKDEILNLFKEALLFKKSIISLDNEIKIMNESLSQLLSSNSIRLESSSYLRKELEIRRLERERRNTIEDYTYTLRKLEHLTDNSINDIPNIGMNVNLGDIADSLDLNEIGVEILELHRIKINLASRTLEERDILKTDFAITGSFNSTVDSSFIRENSISAGLNSQIENLSLSTSIDYNLSAQNISFSLGFSWHNKPRKSENISIMQLQNEIRTSANNQALAINSINQTRDSIQIELNKLLQKEKALDDDLELINVSLDEGIELHNIGIISDTELSSIVLEKEKFLLDIQIFQIEKAIFQNKIESMNYLN